MPRRNGKEEISLTRIMARHSGQAGYGGQTEVDPTKFRTDSKAPGVAAPLVRNIYPPWVYKLPTSQDINANNFAAVLAAAVNATVIPVTFTIPPTNVGWLQIMGIYVLSPTAVTDITFTLRMNEGPVAGWDNIKAPPGATNLTLQNFSDLQVRIPSGGKVDIIVTNNAATGPWTVGGKIAGWYHTELEEKRIYGSL